MHVYKSPAVYPVGSNLFLFEVPSLFLQVFFTFLLNAPILTCNKSAKIPPIPSISP